MSDFQYIYISFISCYNYFIINYYFPEYDDKKNHQYFNLTSFINAIVVGIPSLLIIGEKDIIPFLSQTNPTTIDIYYKLPPLILYGYSLYELHYFIFRKHQLDMFLHGLMMFSFLSLSIYFNSTHLTNIAIMQEMSSIFLNIRVNDFINLLFFSAYTYYRIYLFPKLCIEYFYIEPYDYNVYYFTLIGMLASNSLNFFWYIKLVKIFIKTLYNKFIKPVYGSL